MDYRVVLAPRAIRIVYGIDERSKVIGVARYWHGARGEVGFEDVKP